MSPLMSPLTLSLYLIRHFLLWLGIALIVCSIVGLIGDLATTSRLAVKSQDIGTLDIITISLLRFPNLVQDFMPFVFLFGSIGFFFHLSTTQELVIVRASGLSIWQFITPVLLLTLFIGVIMVGTWNPFSALMSSKAKNIRKNLIYGVQNQLSVSDNGLWLREDVTLVHNKAYIIIHAPQIISSNPIILKNVNYFTFNEDGQIIERLDAAQAILRQDYWILYDIWATRPDGTGFRSDRMARKTELKEKQIQENFVPPRTISFWKLPTFISISENAGFPTEEYKIYFHSLLATPFLFCAMLLISAAFGLRFSRLGGGGRMIIISVITGLALFFVTDFMHTLGNIGLLPPIMAAWGPTAIAGFFGLTLLLHQEDG